MFELMEINSSGFVASNVLGRLFLSWEPRDKDKNELWRTDEIARHQLAVTSNYETAGTLTYHQDNYKAPYIVSKQYEVDGSPL
uniref:Uncharacterized protein n=1 Tax=Ditylenchus dipsaci TaxID=166011 RepID=A0A915EE46_9BILA